MHRAGGEDLERRGDLTRLLAAWSRGDEGALEELAPLVHSELRAVARRQLRREPGRPTLQPTELVHEAFLRLLDQRVTWRNRAHFLGVAATAMRRVLVDRARRRHAAKRPAPELRVTLTELPGRWGGSEVDLLDLNGALEELARLDPRAARTVELRCFGGCSVPEASEVLGVSESTVARDWRMALTWLRRELSRRAGADGRNAPPEGR